MPSPPAGPQRRGFPGRPSGLPRRKAGVCGQVSTGRLADGWSCLCTKLPKALCRELGAGRAGGHLQPSPTGSGLGSLGSFPPLAQFRSSSGPAPSWEGPARPARRWLHLPREAVGASVCVRRGQAVLSWASRGRRPQPSRCYPGNPVSSLGPGGWGTSSAAGVPPGLQAACLCWDPSPPLPHHRPRSLTLCRSCHQPHSVSPASLGPGSSCLGTALWRPHGRCDSTLVPSLDAWGSLQLVLRAAAARSLVTSGQSPAFWLMPVLVYPSIRLPVLRLLKLVTSLGKKKPYQAELLNMLNSINVSSG